MSFLVQFERNSWQKVVGQPFNSSIKISRHIESHSASSKYDIIKDSKGDASNLKPNSGISSSTVWIVIRLETNYQTMRTQIKHFS